MKYKYIKLPKNHGAIYQNIIYFLIILFKYDLDMFLTHLRFSF